MDSTTSGTIMPLPSVVTPGSLTIMDLGSSNGSSVNDIPCMAGECFYLGPDDWVVLGDARFRIRLQPPADSE